METPPPIHETIAHLKKLRENAAELFRSLDSEIARLEALAGKQPSTPLPAAQTKPAPPPPLPQAANTPQIPEEIPAELTQSIKSDVRRGCLLYVLIGGLLFAALVYGIYWLSVRKHADTPSENTHSIAPN